MSTEPEDPNPTRRSLVSRLRRWDDQASWEEFFNTYWRLIYSVAIKAGLTDQESEDVVQETVLSVAKKMGDFRYDPAVCSFRGWLLHVTRLRIQDQFRKRLPTMTPRTRTAGTTALERIPDGIGAGLEALWDEEWEKNIVDVAMTRVKSRVRPEHYQIFYLNVVKEVSVQEVARTLGVSAARVYLVKHRVARLIKSEVRRLERAGIKISLSVNTLGKLAVRWLALRLRRFAAQFLRPRWRFRKYDVAPRLGLRSVERRLRQSLRPGKISSDTQV